MWGKVRTPDDSVVWSLGNWRQRVSIDYDGEDCRRNRILEEIPQLDIEHMKVKMSVRYQSGEGE